MTEGPTALARRLPSEVREGALLAGRYRIGRMLGAGGMGAVFAAEHLELREPVAIKFLLAAGSSAALTRFEREAWAASRIKSEYVARVSDVGRLEDGTPFIVMEYLDGVDLADFIGQSGPLELEQAVELMLQACEALAEAHALGIFHRDLKPPNLFCVRRSDGLLAVKLLDFGISKVSSATGSSSDPHLTTTATTLGTPLYMSPEQMRSGRAADERSDIWSLGVIMYELLTGNLPYSADSLAELAVKIATGQPQPLRAQRRDVPAALERVVARCLEPDSTKRFASVAELAQALSPFGPARAVAHAERAQRILQISGQRNTPALRAQPSFVVGAPGSHARLRSAGASRAKGSSRRRTLLVVSALCGFVAVAVALAVAWSRTLQPSAAEPLRPASSHAVVPALGADSLPPTAAVDGAEDAVPRGTLPNAGPDASAREVADPAAARGRAPTSEPRRAAAAKPTVRAVQPVQPATPSAPAPTPNKGRDSELDSLGGRL